MTAIGFHGRVAVVTGAGGGLGRDYALQLATRGCAVVVNDISAEEAEAVAAEITAAGGRAASHVRSVGTRDGGESLIATAVDRFGRVDIVINNAGNQRNTRFELMTDEDFDAVLDVHLKGAFYVSQPAYRLMLEQGYGRFLFTSSASGMFGNYLRANYAAAKTGVVGLMHSVALEGARRGILANALLPIAASRLGQTPPGAMSPEWDAPPVPGREVMAGAFTPDYVTPLALYLCSERCTATHALWSAVGGRYSRVFIGAARGWVAEPGRPPSPEEIEAHLGEISDPAGFFEPLSVSDEVACAVAAHQTAPVRSD